MLKAFTKSTKSVLPAIVYISPFLTKGIFLNVTYNKDKMVHCISINHCFFLKINFVWANKADPFVAFQQGLRCLLKYLLRDILSTKD